jgi:hypothetical protein
LTWALFESIALVTFQAYASRNTCSCRNALIWADSLEEGPPGAFMIRGKSQRGAEDVDKRCNGDADV